MGPTPFWSQALVASRWVAVLLTSVSVPRELPEGCPCALCIWLLSELAGVASKACILSSHAFSENRTNDHGLVLIKHKLELYISSIFSNTHLLVTYIADWKKTLQSFYSNVSHWWRNPQQQIANSPFIHYKPKKTFDNSFAYAFSKL